MLILLLGGLSAASLFLCGRMRAFPPEYKKYMRYPFLAYLVATPLYHAVYFFLAGFSSWISLFPTVTLLGFISGLVLRKKTTPNPELEPELHSWKVATIENVAALITLLFCPAPHFLLHIQ